MGSTERGDSILGSKLCSFTTSPLCLPEAAVVEEEEEEAALSVLPVEINVGSLSLSVPSSFSFDCFQALSKLSFLFLHRSDVEVGDNGED